MSETRRNICRVEIGPGRIKAICELDNGRSVQIGDAPFNYKEIKKLEVEGTNHADSLEKYGLQLYKTLLRSSNELLEALAIFENSFQGSAKNGLQIRLELMADLLPNLVNIHWELLCNPTGDYLALNNAFAHYGFTRSLHVAKLVSKNILPAVERPRILVVISNPEGMHNISVPGNKKNEPISFQPFEAPFAAVETKALVKLFSELKEQSLIADFKVLCGDLEPPFGDDPVFLKGNPSLGNISKVLQEAEDGDKSFHVIHFLTHGYMSQTGSGYLLLAKENGRAELVPQGQFKDLFPTKNRVRLVVLAACQSGMGGQPLNRPLSGLVPAFLRAGIPSVIAMQEEISISGASLFTEKFYQDLMSHGEIDKAVLEARRKMKVEALTDKPEWHIPVLYMQSNDPRLFDISKDMERRYQIAQDELEILQIRKDTLTKEQDILQAKSSSIRNRIALQDFYSPETIAWIKRAEKIEQRQQIVREESNEIEEKRLKVEGEIQDLNKQIEKYESYAADRRVTLAVYHDLSKKLAEVFSVSDLRAIIAELEIDQEEIGETSVPEAIAIKLIGYMYNRGNFLELAKLIKKKRPGINWP